jgi:hypothetical protein
MLRAVRKATADISHQLSQSFNETMGKQVTKDPPEMKATLVRVESNLSNFEHLISCFNTLFPTTAHASEEMIACTTLSPSGVTFELTPAVQFLKDVAACENLYLGYRAYTKSYDDLCNRLKDARSDPKASQSDIETLEALVATSKAALEQAQQRFFEKCNECDGNREIAHSASLAYIAALLPQKRSFWKISANPYVAPIAAPVAAVAPGVLPPDWTEGQTPEGKVFYSNVKTKKVQYNHPNPAPVRDPSASYVAGTQEAAKESLDALAAEEAVPSSSAQPPAANAADSSATTASDPELRGVDLR